MFRSTIYPYCTIKAALTKDNWSCLLRIPAEGNRSLIDGYRNRLIAVIESRDGGTKY